MSPRKGGASKPKGTPDPQKPKGTPKPPKPKGGRRDAITAEERQAIRDEVATWPPFTAEQQTLIARVMGPRIEEIVRQRAATAA